MTIAASFTSDKMLLVGAEFRGTTDIHPADPEPPVGSTLLKGAPVGLGDNLRFERVGDGPDGWVEYRNGGLRGRRVSYETVRFWQPMKRAA